MASYLYKCDVCNSEFTVNKPMSDAGKDSYCPTCNKVAIRVYTSSSIKTGDGIKHSK